MMSNFDLSIITEYVLPKTDLYHPNHPFHHLVLEEIEEYELAMQRYDPDQYEKDWQAEMQYCK